MRIFSGLLLLLSLASAAHADWRGEESLSALDADLGEIMEDSSIAGAAAALVDASGPFWVRTYGVADRESERPLLPETPLRWGSISKSMTAVALMLLVEQGELELEDTLAALAPEVPFANPYEETHPVRVIHLLEHTAGWDDIGYTDYAFSSPNASIREYALRESGDRVSHWKPGFYFRYANGGPAVAGYLAEKLAGVSYDDFVEQAVFGPLDMPSASFRTDDELMTWMSRSYIPGMAAAERYWHMNIRPSGAVHGTVGDLGRFTAFLIRRGRTAAGEPLLSEASVRRLESMEASVVAREGGTVGYAKGQFHYLRADRTWHGHWGKVDGFRAAYGYLPDHGRGFVLLVNTLDGAARGKMLTRIAEAAAAGLAASPPPVPDEAALAELAGLEGYYVGSAANREMTGLLESVADVMRVTVDAGERRVRVSRGTLEPQVTEYVPVGGRLLQLENASGASAAIVEGDDGREFVAGARFAHRPGWQVFGTAALWLVSAALLLALVGYALFWMPLAFAGRYRPRAVALRAAPLVSGLSAAAVFYMVVFGLFYADDGGAFERAGHPSLWSASVYLLSWLFPLGALAGIGLAWAGRDRSDAKSLPRVVAVSSGCVFLALAAYWAAYGWIGLETWS